MSFRLKLKNANFTKIAAFVGYPILTGLTNLYYMGVDAPSTADNRVPNSTDGTVLGTLTYSTYEAIQGGSNAALDTGAIDNTQAVTFIAVMKVPTPTNTEFGFAISNFAGGLSGQNIVSLGKRNAASQFEFVVSPQNNGLTGTFVRVTGTYPSTASYVFVAGTIDSAGLMRMFVGNNGVLTKTTNASGITARTFAPGSIYMLNSRERATTMPISMAMGAIHKTSLSDADIDTIYQNLRAYFDGKIALF